jgi:hypothetical protein
MIEQMVNEAAYESLQKSRPGMVAAIRELVSMGQTPRQIRDHLASRAPAWLLITIESAACHIADSEPERWYCQQCGFVPVTEIVINESGAHGICKCGQPIDQVPF